MADIRDFRDILDLDRGSSTDHLRDSFFGSSDKVKAKKNVATNSNKLHRRPEGMALEVYRLIHDRKDVAPLMPTDTGTGYKHEKAKLGMKKARPWKWTPFLNPARKDNSVFYHWRRVADENNEYPFAQFNKQVDIPSYSDADYLQYLKSDDWTKEETDHLFDLCLRFDRRFVIVHDRYNSEQFKKKRDIEDLKERFYSVCNMLKKARHTENTPYHEPKAFDADHERKRKEQLNKLFSRTKEQIEEEQMLTQELKKIEARKKEREKKASELQRLMSGADSPAEPRKQEKRQNPRKKLPSQVNKLRVEPNVCENVNEIIGIKFPDHRTTGAITRSSRLKLPITVGQKKIKIIEAKLKELGLDLNPVPTEEICALFNELRSDIIIQHELKNALSTCLFEIESCKHQYESLKPDETLEIPESILNENSMDM